MRITDICMNCGNALGKHSCSLCGARVCDACFNTGKQVCVRCLSEEI